MDHMGRDSVYLQEMTVSNWKHGEQEQGRIISSFFGMHDITVAALLSSWLEKDPGLNVSLRNTAMAALIYLFDAKDILK